MRSASLVFVATLLAVASIEEAQAFRFSPFRARFAPSGPGANQLFSVENNADTPATVQISVVTREADVDGTEKNSAAENDFAIYPAQLILQPGEQRSVRIQWLGAPDLKTERAYRVVAEQLPVNLNRDQPHTSQVKFLTTYRAALFVTPAGLSQEVVLDFFGREYDTQHDKFIEVVFHNRGTQHALLRDLKLEMKDDANHTVTLSGEKQLQGLTGEGVLTGHRRRFLLPWPTEMTGKLTTINFSYDKQAF